MQATQVPVAEFRSKLLALFFADVHQLQQDNYSYERFSFDGVDRSLIFDVDRHTAYLEWMMTKSDDIYRCYTRLSDSISRDIYLNVLRFKLAGHLHVRIIADVARRVADGARFRAAFAGTPSTLASSGMFGKLVHYDGDWGGKRYTVDTTRDALIYPLLYRQYFLQRPGVNIQPEPGEYVLDCGHALERPPSSSQPLSVQPGAFFPSIWSRTIWTSARLILRAQVMKTCP